MSQGAPPLPSSLMPSPSRRAFLRSAALAGAALATTGPAVLGQIPGERPAREPSVKVLNPQTRVPVGLIINDSTCLVNLNKFAMPQFDAAFDGTNESYHKNWRDWPNSIPDSFVRK